MKIVNKNHSGQVALLMVLIMTVISAVAVSLASRSTVETRVQQMEIESTQALLTAQAGLEQAIFKDSSVSGSLESGKNYNVTVDAEGVSEVTTEKVDPGNAVDVNLVGASGVTGARIYWRAAVAGGRPAIFVSDVRSDRIYDYAYDSEGTYGFTSVVSGGSLNGVNYTYVTPSPVTISSGNSVSLRITVLGAPAFVGVEPVGGLFPPQSLKYRSVASVGSGDSSIKYGIEYKESVTNQLPSVFDYVLFSGGTINQ
jgi:hypothetical protein